MIKPFFFAVAIHTMHKPRKYDIHLFTFAHLASISFHNTCIIDNKPSIRKYNEGEYVCYFKVVECNCIAFKKFSSN